MHKSIGLISVLTLLINPTIAHTANEVTATYVIQATSNLGCEALSIELISQTQDTRQNIVFTTGAFAAAQLAPGTYTFGDVTCKNAQDEQSFDVLSGIISEFSVNTSQAYYGGRIIFQKNVEMDINSAPQALSNCTRSISRARGDSGEECLDGTGADTSAPIAKQLNVYIPEVTPQDVDAVRKALSATKEQLIYLPLT